MGPPPRSRTIPRMMRPVIVMTLIELRDQIRGKHMFVRSHHVARVWGSELDLREDKLALAIGTGTEQVDDNHDDETYGYPCSVVDRLIPEVNEDGGSAELGGENDRPVEEGRMLTLTASPSASRTRRS